MLQSPSSILERPHPEIYYFLLYHDKVWIRPFKICRDFLVHNWKLSVAGINVLNEREALGVNMRNWGNMDQIIFTSEILCGCTRCTCEPIHNGDCRMSSVNSFVIFIDWGFSAPQAHLYLPNSVHD